MAQHDYVIANQSGSSFRSDLNNALSAIVSNNSGSSEPTTTYAYQWWADTTNGQLKLRNAANSAWITIQELDGTMLMEDGTAAAPGLAFASDLNTGFYRIGADQLGIATNGTAAVAVDASQRVGIGTTAPTTKLDIYTGSATGTYVKVENTEGRLFAGVYGTGEGYLATETSDPLILGTNGGEKARIDTSGRLLVGTSTARANFFNSTESSKLQVEGTVTSDSSISVVRNSNNSGYPFIAFGKTRGTTVGANTVVQPGDPVGGLEFMGSDGTEFVTAGSIRCEIDSTPGTDDMPGRLVFSTTADGASSPTERMRISSSGTHQMYGLDDTFYSRTNRGAGTTYAVFVGVHSATSTVNGTLSSVIWSNGNVQNTNGSYTAISDVKLKENIVAAGSQWDDLKAIQIRNWNFKAETGYETHRQIGPIAQELETVCPGLVFETPDRDADGNKTGEVTKGVNQSVLYMKAVKALQEAMERIETLEAKVAALEAA